MTEDAIRRFSERVGDKYTHMFLSNFYVEPFNCGLLGDVLTAEHAYQAYKCVEDEDRTAVLEAPTPAAAKKMGRSIKLRTDWEVVKIPVMRSVLFWKFDLGSGLAQRLLDTGDAWLEEGNDWGDRTWGTVEGTGANWLGHLLMARRAELRARI